MTTTTTPHVQLGVVGAVLCPNVLEEPRRFLLHISAKVSHCQSNPLPLLSRKSIRLDNHIDEVKSEVHMPIVCLGLFSMGVAFSAYP